MEAPAYYTNWGPRDAPILGRDDPPALGIFDSPEARGMPIGVAYPDGLTADPRGPAKVFRLVVGKVELEGRWICRGRRFVALGDSAEEL